MRKKSEYELAPGVLVEHVGSECVVWIPETTDVVTLSGDAAETLRQIIFAAPGNYNSETLSHLVSLGIIHSPSDISRRSVVRAGLVGLGAGIATLSLPSVAAASSAEEGPGPYTINNVPYSNTGDTINNFTLEMTPTVPDGTTGTVTLAGGQDVAVTFREATGVPGSDKHFRSADDISGLSISGSTEFWDLSHTLRFSVSGASFAVPFVVAGPM